MKKNDWIPTITGSIYNNNYISTCYTRMPKTIKHVIDTK